MTMKTAIDHGDKPVIIPTNADFKGKQLDLFRSFLCNGAKERDMLSNTVIPHPYYPELAYTAT